MSENTLRLAVIVGSVRQGRFGPTVAHWFTTHARQRPDLAVDVVDLADVTLPELTPRLAAADAFVVVTPEYNHSFPGALKNAIDGHDKEWHAKPVGFVSYGGLSGGLRAVEHLRVVFAELHAVTVSNTVSFHGAAARFDADGNPTEPSGCDPAATLLLDQLTWWAHALRTAKTTTPYAA
jgi:NAD(P)H-dependent FMN reductase